MSLTVLSVSMPVDGFITGLNASIDNRLGDGGQPLRYRATR